MLRVCKWVVPRGFAGITLYPFVFLSDKKHLTNKPLLNHECIHLEQQRELFVIGFYLWYLLEFLWKLAKYRNKDKAYRNVCFEREAYQNEINLNYLSSRERFAFKRYLK